ncbi:hypothetical protein EVAR_97509_1 [Eumeta japonica]|uniref:Mariner Mos1 transposase n=1 Tax=Eumeta variegata TaxID=151549 RepID=A0A4C1WNZ8_EUMVA|nr:hypothetical protein EVAR_97509_1 [Eumeta japonica]
MTTPQRIPPDKQLTIWGPLCIEILTHPLYSPDLTPCNSYLFSKIKEKLRRKWFTDAEEEVAAYEKAVKGTQKWIAAFRYTCDVMRQPPAAKYFVLLCPRPVPCAPTCRASFIITESSVKVLTKGKALSDTLSRCSVSRRDKMSLCSANIWTNCSSTRGLNVGAIIFRRRRQIDTVV